MATPSTVRRLMRRVEAIAGDIVPKRYVIITGVPRPEPRTVCDRWEVVTELPGVPRSVVWFEP